MQDADYRTGSKRVTETLDSGVVRLESDVARISINAADIKADLWQMRGETVGLRDKTDENRIALRTELRNEMQAGLKEVGAQCQSVDSEFKQVCADMQTGFKGVDAEFKKVREETQAGFKGVDGEFRAARADLAQLATAITNGDLGTRISMLVTMATVTVAILGVMTKGSG